ncbi:hypothetical protein AB0J07_25945, partial [Microbispora rosea]
MPTIAFTGHRGLPRDTAVRVRRALRAVLAGRDRPLVGLSCLAEGGGSRRSRRLGVRGRGRGPVGHPGDRRRDGAG